MESFRAPLAANIRKRIDGPKASEADRIFIQSVLHSGTQAWPGRGS